MPGIVSATREPVRWKGDMVTFEWSHQEILRFYQIRKGHTVNKTGDDENSSEIIMEVSAAVGRSIIFRLALWLDGKISKRTPDVTAEA